MRWYITRKETTIMKGMAIWAIPLHNLLHWTGPLVKENEFFFNYSHRAYWMSNHLQQLHPNLLGDILSFFGWYGVPVFMFLSGYGVCYKYEQACDEDCAWGPFIRYNFGKLFRLMAPAFFVYLLLQSIGGSYDWQWKDVLAQLTLLINVVCDPKSIDPGVYWYFGLTFQFYLFYRLFLHKRAEKVFWLVWLLWLVGDTLFLLAVLPDPMLKQQPQMEYIRHNCVGWLLPFLMGVGWARMALKQTKPLPGQVIHRSSDVSWAVSGGLSLLLLICCSFESHLWLLTPAFAIIATYAFTRCLQHTLVGRMACWMGALSSFLFVVHPVVRPFFRSILFRPDQLLMDLRTWGVLGCYFCLSVSFAYLYRWLLRKIPY